MLAHRLSVLTTRGQRKDAALSIACKTLPFVTCMGPVSSAVCPLAGERAIAKVLRRTAIDRPHRCACAAPGGLKSRYTHPASSDEAAITNAVSPRITAPRGLYVKEFTAKECSDDEAVWQGPNVDLRTSDGIGAQPPAGQSSVRNGGEGDQCKGRERA